MNTTIKKLTAILAAGCLLASLAACKGPEVEPGATDSTLLQSTQGQNGPHPCFMVRMQWVE